VAYDAFYKFYEEHGLVFERSLLTTYCLSLYTKPFVILSGISGSGKTKIAQLFNEPTRQAIEEQRPAAQTPAAYLPGTWILMTVTDGILSGDGRANLRYSDLGALLPEAELRALEPLIEELKKQGVADNICDPFEIVIDGADGERIIARAYLQRASSPLLRLRFKSKRGEPEYDSTGYFRKHHHVNDVLKFERVGDRHLRLVSVNDTAVLRKSSQLDADEARHIRNMLFISVRSDWTDSSYLFGYFNLIDQKYHVTPLLDFLLTAAEYPTVPFFLILDEMNLAKVEHYFSDFLSCLESRYMADGLLRQEPIKLQAGSGWLETDNVYFDTIPPEVTIPQNLFVTGTVNVDESTYMFSPKVLDRANVIELNDINIDEYEEGISHPGYSPLILDRFPPLMDFCLPARTDFIELPDDAKIFLKAVHGILAKYQLQFGYRVINEIARYVRNAMAYCEASATRLDIALDYQLLQKVLPKLNGSQGKLDLPIRDLIHFLAESPGDTAELTFERIVAVAPATTRYPRSIAKLQRMYVSLTLNGFATYIE